MTVSARIMVGQIFLPLAQSPILPLPIGRIKVCYSQAVFWPELGMSESQSMDLIKNLLMRYYRPSSEERSVWQARVMELEGATSNEITKMHGELIAQGWIEQNLETILGRDGGSFLQSSYRITPSGVRTTKGLQESLAEELDS